MKMKKPSGCRKRNQRGMMPNHAPACRLTMSVSDIELATSSGSAARGRSSSLNISLTTSASGCSTPFGPTRYGPSRCCRSAATFRSTYTMTAAELSSMKNTKSVRTICAMRSGVIRDASSRERRNRGGSRASVRSDGLPRAPVGGQRAPPLPDVRLVLVPEVLQRREHRRDGGVAERAQRLAGDIVRDPRQEIEIAHLAVAPFDALQDLVQPVGPLAARRALAARLVAGEQPPG